MNTTDEFLRSRGFVYMIQGVEMVNYDSVLLAMQEYASHHQAENQAYISDLTDQNLELIHDLETVKDELTDINAHEESLLAEIEGYRSNERYHQGVIKDCRDAIEWALNNTTADHESVQSDFFNILMNARTAADKILNPDLPENQPHDPKQELNF